MTTVLITGANRGIGLEFVRQYAAEGAEVLACCRDPEGAQALKALAAESGGRVRVLSLDVADEASIAALKPQLGDAPIDIAINNAGISGRGRQSIGTLDAAAWLETLRVNAVAPVLVAQALHANLAAGREKKLVAITSQLGSTASNGGARYYYRSSKAALNNAMHGLSRDWAGEGITVGIFHPGWVQTDMGGAGAPVTVSASVEGLRQRIAELKPADSGAFRDYAGASLPW
ncbi:MAG TPA: SDR family oxidoreductase [Phenylobacterium sp.]|jgi:NAD(P)-dependent dehydrogenase (short-subunit alcohol dehydrogenase family)|nr:SDR family oxidoreductase [Phenylobacterium sp.]